jgi:hypothetical protein
MTMTLLDNFKLIIRMMKHCISKEMNAARCMWKNLGKTDVFN